MNKSRKLYIKLFVMYSVSIFILASVLDVYLINNIMNSKKEDFKYINQVKIEEINSFISNQYNSGQLLSSMLYSSPAQLEDLMIRLKISREDYLKYRLDKFSSSNEYTYNGDQFIKSSMSYNENIAYISFYSFANNIIYNFGNNSQVEIIDNFKIEVKKDIRQQLSSIVLNNIDEKEDKNFFNVTKYIREGKNLENVGVMVMTYDLSEIEKFIKKYDKNYSEIAIIDKYDKVLYNNGDIDEKELLYYDKNFVNDTNIGNKNSKYIDITYSADGVRILGIIDKRDIFIASIREIINIQLIMVILSLSIIYVINQRLKKLQLRLNEVLSAMESVEKGNFDIRIDIDKTDDDINIIAKNFNNMCETLNQYINKVYVSELNEKEAEYNALQSKINPHFLYNTLEIIRMKAIVGGNKEVGKMIYNLANLFRNTIKDDKFISIEREIHNCRMYLEIAKFRYGNNVSYEISHKGKVLNNQILKFTLQPLVENFFIHGIDVDKDYNHIDISIEEAEESIDIYIKDNGRGISKEKIIEINRFMRKVNSSLNKHVKKESTSIGITNVHERIVRIYGTSYGITILNTGANGAKLLIKIPKQEEENYV